MGKWKRSAIIYLCQAIAIWTLCGSIAHAVTLKVNGSDIYLSGKINYEDEKKLIRIINSYPKTNRVVITSSPGGNLWAGIKMGEAIREYGLTTHITNYCASACNHVFAGGFFRDMNEGAKLGIHVQSFSHPSGYYSERELRIVEEDMASSTMWNVYHYLTMGISIDVVQIMADTPFDEMYWMYKREAKQLNFVNK